MYAGLQDLNVHWWEFWIKAWAHTTRINVFCIKTCAHQGCVFILLLRQKCNTMFQIQLRQELKPSEHFKRHQYVEWFFDCTVRNKWWLDDVVQTAVVNADPYCKMITDRDGSTCHTENETNCCSDYNDYYYIINTESIVPPVKLYTCFRKRLLRLLFS